MGTIISNIKVIMPFFAVPWIILILSVIYKPQKLRNCYLLMLALFFSAVLLTGFFGDYMGKALLILFLFVLFSLFLVPILLIANGILLIKKEGLNLPHMLSLLLGLGIGTGEIAAIISLISTFDTLIPVEYGTGTTILFVSVFYISVVILAFVLYVLFIQWLPHRMNFEYVIIHGSGLIDGHKVSRLLSNRIDKAIEIYQKCSRKPILIPSGGKGTDEDLSEAQAIMDYLLAHGIPRKHILIEDQSTTTMENLSYSKALIDNAGGTGRIALISSNYHVYRCLVYAAKLKMKCTGIGAKVALYYWPSAVIREFIAIYSRRKHLALLILGYLVIVGLPTLVFLLG